LGELLATTLLTAVYGNYDPLRPLPPNHGFDRAVCVTDNPTLSADGWEMMVVPSNLSPRLASKRPKMLPFEFVDDDVVVWLDAAFEIVGDGFQEFCVNALGDHNFVVWDHPDRGTRPDVYAEATFSNRMEKYWDQPLDEQVAYYRSRGLPDGSGLWACGTIVWGNKNKSKQFGRAWYHENLRWSIQDQVSFPYVVWKLKPNFGVFPAHEYENPYLRWWMHEHSS